MYKSTQIVTDCHTCHFLFVVENKNVNAILLKTNLPKTNPDECDTNILLAFLSAKSPFKARKQL